MSNQQPLTMSRRRFLTGAAALAAAPLLAGLWPKAAPC
ncbi:twin-arginine translocation signal domain-containing protein [Serratia marcescens]|nr:twin-arginine translocation signal domain-containing protein [Serratia marcescens]